MNIALLGAAHIHTPGFVKRINDRADVSATWVWDHDRSRADRNAEALGATVAPDLDAVRDDPDIDAVVVCSETDRHESLVSAACEARKHLFVEKPLGFGSDDAFRMAKAIDTAGVRFQTGYFMRGIPAYRFLRSEIAAGRLGTITRIRMSNCHAGAIRDIFTPDWLWMTDPEIAGVGAFGDLGTHVLDIMLWLIDAPVRRVTATTNRALDAYGPGCDEYGEGLIEFENGVIGSIAAGWVDPVDPVKLDISGTEGHATFRDGALYYWSDHVDGADGSAPWSDLPAAWPHAFELFLDSLTGASPPQGEQEIPLVKPAEAARRSDIMEACYRAAQAGCWEMPTEG